MRKVVIIDDEPLARSIVGEYLAGQDDLQVVAECANGFEGLKAIQQHTPDLVFLDIQMPRINGFEMLELLDEIPPVIFATAYDEYAIKAFESSAIDYLLKPFTKTRFLAALSKWRTALSGKTNPLHYFIGEVPKQKDEGTRIVVRTNAEISIVPTAEVHYIEAFDDYVKIFTKNTFFLKKKTMGYYESVLPPDIFFRTHRSFIINLNELTRIEPLEKNTYVVLLRSGKRVPLSRSCYLKLREKLGV
jgi:two-component system, LytTR family, response regulator